MPLLYPVTTELHDQCEAIMLPRAIRDFFDQSAATLARELDRGVTVAVICEGDPLFYGSYMYPACDRPREPRYYGRGK